MMQGDKKGIKSSQVGFMASTDNYFHCPIIRGISLRLVNLLFGP